MLTGKWSGIRLNETIEWSTERKTKASKGIKKRLIKERKGIGRNSSLIITQKTDPSDLGRRRRMIDTSNRKLAEELSQETNLNGAELAKVCVELHIHVQTYERWAKNGEIQ